MKTKPEKVVEVSKSEAKHVGKIEDSKYLALHQVIGEAKACKVSYVMCSILPSQRPMVISKQTGKRWTITWQDLIELAVEAGIDKP